MNAAPVTPGGRLVGLVGVVLILAGLAKMWSVANDGVDFPSMYVMGTGIAAGANVYDPSVPGTFPGRFGVVQPLGMFYPPASGFAMLPFALFPYGVAKVLWFLAICASLVFGVRAMVRVAAPRAGFHVWTLCAGIVLVSSAVRWGMALLQGAPLLLGLLCLFIAALHGGWPRAAFVLAAFATALKMTLALPFLGLLALHRRFGALFASGAAWVLLNGLGFWRMGSTLTMYRANMGALEALNDVNSPDPWFNPGVPRLDWTFLSYGLTHQLAFSRMLCLSLSAGVALWLLFEGLRARLPADLATSTAFLTVLVCLGSLAVYHHEYDASLFLAPLLLGVLLWRRMTPPNWAVACIAPLTLIVLLMPLGKVRELMSNHFGVLGVGLVKLTFPIAFTLALIGSIGLLRWNASSSRVASESDALNPSTPD